MTDEGFDDQPDGKEVQNCREEAADQATDETLSNFKAEESESTTGPIAGYKILKELSRGGQGVVYQAIQVSTRRKVALKVMLQGPFASSAHRHRFDREIALVGSLRHPNIVPILDGGEAHGQAYFAMEYIRGQPLDKYVHERSLSVEETIGLFGLLCDAIDHAHQKGIIHRDLKPSNVLVDNRGKPQVLDFGLAKVGGSDVTESLVSVTGQIIGTPAYMSPEQASGRSDDVDMRSDVYSLGVILFQLLTGQLPYDVKGSVPEVCRRIVESEPTRASTVSQRINDELDTIVLKCMAKEKDRRYYTAGALGHDLDRFLKGEPIEAKRDSVLYVVRMAMRRYKVPAAVATAFLVLLTVSSVVAWGLYGSATRARNAEAALRIEADRARDVAVVARQDAVQALYVSDMNSVQDLYTGGDVGRAFELLERHRAVYQRRFEWRFLWRLCEQGDALHTLRSHTNVVTSVAYAENGNLATGCADGDVRLFNGSTRQVLDIFPHPSQVSCLAWARGGEILAVGTEDGLVTLWDVATRIQSRTFEHTAPVRSLAISSSDDAMAVGISGNTNREDGEDQLAQMLIYDLRSGGEPRTVPWGPRRITFSPDGNLLIATSGRGLTVRLWDMVDGTELESIDQPHTSIISALAISPDGKVLATGSWDTVIKLWDVESRRHLRTFRGHQSWVGWLAFSPDGRTLASASRDGTIRLWNANDREPVDAQAYAMLRGHTSTVNGVVFSPDGETLVSGSDDKTIKIWPANGPRDQHVLTGNDDWVYSVDFSPDDLKLASGCFDGTVRIWDLDTRRPIHSEKLHANQVFTVRFSPTGRWLASCDGVWRTGGSRDFSTPGAVIISNVDGLTEEAQLPNITTGVRALAFSPDESMLAAGDHDGWLKIWDVQRSKLIVSKDLGARSESMAFSPDSSSIVLKDLHGNLTQWNARTLERLFTYPGVGGFYVVFSPDGTKLAAGDARLWDVRTGQELVTFEGHKASVMCIQFSPDGKTLATSSVDHTIRLWSVESGQSVVTLRGHRGPVSGLAFSHDGTILASSGEDRTVRLWQAAPIGVHTPNE